MSVHMKMPPTKVKNEDTTYVITQFVGPADQLDSVKSILEEYGFRLAGKTEMDHESVPWREAFPDLQDEDIPAIRLRGARLKEDITQKELSERTGIPQGHISDMESGKRVIGLEVAKKLGDALNIDYRVFV